MKLGVLVLVAVVLFGAAPGAAQEAKPSPAIAVGSRVSLEYTLTDAEGTVLDSSQGRPPLTYTHGVQQIVPGLEKALTGMHVGETKKVTVAPADAYGEVDSQAVIQVPKADLPEGVAAGTQLVARSPDGETRVVRVKEIRDETALIDLNHPLAGKTLHFDVKVIGVEPPAK